MAKTPTAKVDLKLLKKLVGELETSLVNAEAIKKDAEDAKSDTSDYVVEMSKCAGLAAGIMAESTMLVGDIQNAVHASQGPAPKGDPLSKLLAGLKGGGGLPGTN